MFTILISSISFIFGITTMGTFLIPKQTKKVDFIRSILLFGLFVSNSFLYSFVLINNDSSKLWAALFISTSLIMIPVIFKKWRNLNMSENRETERNNGI